MNLFLGLLFTPDVMRCADPMQSGVLIMQVRTGFSSPGMSGYRTLSGATNLACHSPASGSDPEISGQRLTLRLACMHEGEKFMANIQHSKVARADYVEHAVASAQLSGRAPSSYLASLLNEYRLGRLSSAQLLDKARAHYLGVDASPE